MNIGLITTLNTNIGDDFIRLGIQRVLRSMFPGEALRWEYLNKHHPETLWPRWHPSRYLPAWAPNGRRLAGRMGKSRFHGCDWIVQCGAPVIWKNCARCEWNRPVWQEVVRELHGRIPVMNLAIGSAYSPSAVPDRIESEADREYIRSILGYCRLTTARDRLVRSGIARFHFGRGPGIAGHLRGPQARRRGGNERSAADLGRRGRRVCGNLPAGGGGKRACRLFMK